MSEVEPAVVRVLDVPTGVLLPELHNILQVTVGWSDSHLHQFVADGVSYGMPNTDAFDGERVETGVPLRALLAHFTYLYDFGDGWEHAVEMIGGGGERPRVVAGEGACPPEDVGGPHGYAEFRKALADPGHAEHDHLREWAGNWHDRFDLATADLLLRQTVGAVPAPVRLLLDLAADGIKLTPGGRLPRTLVRQIQELYASWSTAQDLAARLLGLLGDRWVTSEGFALDVARTRSELYRLKPVIVGLDLVQNSQGVWAASPSARWLLPRATALAHLWSS
jgi:hypothetical protein